MTAMQRTLPMICLLAALGCSTPASVRSSARDAQSAPAGQAQPNSGWDFGYRGGLSLSSGKPANDLEVPLNLFARRAMGDDWSLAFELEYSQGDFEAPAKAVGLVQDPAVDVIDSYQSGLTVRAAAERALWAPTQNDLVFGTLGLGLAFPDVDDVSGPLAGGGTFDITTDPGTEFLASFGLGYQHKFGPSWAFESLVRYEQHFADWEVSDRNSGATGTINDYNNLGLLIGFSFHH